MELITAYIVFSIVAAFVIGRAMGRQKPTPKLPMSSYGSFSEGHSNPPSHSCENYEALPGRRNLDQADVVSFGPALTEQTRTNE